MINPRRQFRVLAVTGVIMLLRGASVSAAPLKLHDAIDKALRFAPSIAMASGTSSLTEARAREQRAALFPSISAGTEYYQAPGYNPVITNRGLSSALLALDYTAFDWGRRAARYRAARYVSEAATLGVAAARAQIAFDTRGAYYDLLRARATERELSGSRDRLNRYVATVEELLKSGRAIENDVLKIRSARDSAELALASGQGDMRRASANLGSLIGDFDATDIEVADDDGLPPPPARDITQSPSIQVAKRAISAASQQVRAARTERLPTFQVALTTGFLGIDPAATVNHNYGASYDGVISMPVFEGGLISSHIDQALAKQQTAQAQMRQTQFLLERRLSDAALRYQQVSDQLKILARAQPTADDAFALTWTRFLGGGGATVLEVLDAYQQAEQLRLQRYAYEFGAREAAAESLLLAGRVQ
ncbi:MAG TPA: TolC family protein [Candidatus Binataceae bacterium]|nr:TolC family protein [Candidatus Binataceae bacterium]